MFNYLKILPVMKSRKVLEWPGNEYLGNEEGLYSDKIFNKSPLPVALLNKIVGRSRDHLDHSRQSIGRKQCAGYTGCVTKRNAILESYMENCLPRSIHTTSLSVVKYAQTHLCFVHV